MSRKPGFLGKVESVGAPTEGHLEAFKAELKQPETTEAGTTFRLRGRDDQEKIFRIRRHRNPYFELHTDIVKSREAKPVYVEPEDDDEQVASRILVPHRRRVADIRDGPLNTEVRTQDSPLRLVVPGDLPEMLEHLKAAWRDRREILITHDPETHVILDVSDPFDRSEAGPRTEAAQVETEPLSLRRAVEAFEHIARRCEIPFDYPDEYCNARAHQMFRLLREQRISCEKIWNFADEGTQESSSIRVYTPNHPDGAVTWGFHVAVLVNVRLPNYKGTVVDMVFDPSLVHHPIRISDWVALQHDSTAVQERSPPDVYGQEVGGTERSYDLDFTNTEGTLKKARGESWRRRIDLETWGCEERYSEE